VQQEENVVLGIESIKAEQRRTTEKLQEEIVRSSWTKYFIDRSIVVFVCCLTLIVAVKLQRNKE